MLRRGGSSSVDRGHAERELRALFDEVADVDWSRPDWRALTWLLAVSEAGAQRRRSPDAAAEAFVRALEANAQRSADTFMAVASAPPPDALEARIDRAVARARAVAETLARLHDLAPDQPLLAALRLEGGWLRSTPLATGGRRVPIAFLVGGGACLAEIGPDTADAALARALRDAARGRPSGLARVEPDDRAPTRAAAAIAVEPLGLGRARSLHRDAWSRGGGPWMGVADAAPFSVVSTCHAAVDGYVHAKVTDAVLGADAWPGRHAAQLDVGLGFATCRVSPAPRFAAAAHAFGIVLDRHLGGSGARSVPFHVPIAPGGAGDEARWRRRPLYGLLALTRRDDRLETAEALAARLPAWVAREAGGGGLLTRVLRATLEAPAPPSLRRYLIARQPWMDRWIPAARVLTGGGYLSWMRFEAGEEPSRPVYPSAVPSFAVHRGGAGLSITRSGGGLSAGLTTSGELGTAEAAARFLDDWRDALRAEGR